MAMIMMIMMIMMVRKQGLTLGLTKSSHKAVRSCYHPLLISEPARARRGQRRQRGGRGRCWRPAPAHHSATPGDSGEDEEEGGEEERQTGCTDEGGMPQYSRQVRLQVTRCQELITAIETSAARSLIPPQSPVALPELQTTATTLGLAYNSSRVVTRVLIGGPAFLCGAIAEGDMLEAINGVALGMQGEREGEDVATMLTGSDEPGSQCHVSFKSLASGHTQTWS